MNIQTVFTCPEYSEVEIPITEFLRGATIDVFPEISECGLFDVDYRRSELRIVSKGYVGLIPLNNRVALRVIPRFPIRNVFYLLQKSDESVRNLPSFLRSYRIEDGYFDRMDYIVGSHFVESLYAISHDGLSKRYLRREESKTFKGRLLVGPTISQGIARNQKHRHCREVYSLTEDNPENRIIHRQLVRLRKSLLSEGGDSKILKKVEKLLLKYSRIGLPLRTDRPEMLLELLKRDPFIPPHFRSVIWLAFLLETRKGISITEFGPSSFASMVVNMADVFEGYVRSLIIGYFAKIAGAIVKNGNKDPVPLFRGRREYVTQPDIYVTLSQGQKIVLDAKYKPKRSTSDRYEIIAFCEALESKIAVVIAPMTNSTLGRRRLLGETAQGVRFYELFVDLGHADIFHEEQGFLDGLTDLLADCGIPNSNVELQSL